MSKVTTDSITLRIADIVEAGDDVSAAIIAACEESEYLSSGTVGPSFSCSGPGSGWQRNHDTGDYAARALSGDCGAHGYVDADDGRLATLDEDDEVVWSEESVVEAEVPDHDEVDEHPAAALAMLRAVRTGLIVAHESDWADVAALLDYSQEDALARISGSIHGDSVIYYDDSMRRWYVQPASDLTDLRILMGSADEDTARDAYSHWCAGTSHLGDYETEEEAIASIA